MIYHMFFREHWALIYQSPYMVHGLEMTYNGAECLTKAFIIYCCLSVA